MKKKQNISSFNIPIVKEVLNQLSIKNHISIKKLTGSYKTFLINQLFQSGINPLIICANYNIAEEFFNDIKVFIPEEVISFMLPPQKNIVNSLDKSEEHFGWLIEALANFNQQHSVGIIVPEVLEHTTPSLKIINSEHLTLSVGENIAFDDFIKKFLLKGFDRKNYVASQGDIAVRGGIVDIFPIGQSNPLRIEFWGDTIDSIREFAPVSQRSIKNYKEISFIADLFLDQKLYDVSIIDSIDKNTLLILDEPDTFNLDVLNRNNIQFKRLDFNALGDADIRIKTEPFPTIDSSIKSLCKEIIYLNDNKYNIIITADGKTNLNRLKDLICHEFENISLPKIADSIIWNEQPLSSGFVSENDLIVVFTEHQIFNRLRTKTGRRKKFDSITFAELQALHIGDYIVHEDKGIARFEGFITIEIGGAKQDCLKLTFADDGIVYVSLNYISKISKYSAQDGHQPILSKLGTGEWLKRKARAKSKIKDIARDLIKLYALRKTKAGFAFPTDNDWQREFEASFIYEDTPDQMTATDDIKFDMTSSFPMDRLICGDVGFGKTEVAIRATFKAVQAGKQVAILVPTTILAHQHFMSFCDRMSRYPVRIEVLSRFRSKKEQLEILKDLESGRVDILIGTHRILSKDIIFKDLGLLVIDEEHRFGVSSKEKLRHLRENVDTLTLTATPIPRTLNFSLMGARDLSIMETPPRNRLPVYTQIINWDEELIIEAIKKEIGRNGQCFIVNDKVNDLEDIANKLRASLPSLKFGIAHGQMPGNLLEKEMELFIEGKYDVLIATKIIESGIDIPNANTIIINRANNFGLAELYQLRGRVGRTNKQAYCYLVVPNSKTLTNTAIKRLQAVEEFTDLGSGFKLAMRDLEIRGAGNLLGAEQSGFIIDMGFELYQKILDEAVEELKNEEFLDYFPKSDEISFQNDEIAIEIMQDALFPDSYISNSTDRYLYYRKLYKIRELKELDDVIVEITDKYGRLPEQAQNLIFVIKIRIAGIKTGFTRITVKENHIICELPPKENEKFYEYAFPFILDYLQTIENSKLVQSKNKLFIQFEIESRDSAVEHIWRLKRNLEFVG